jgi:cell division protein FtsI (penicillin-binding protein 3)
MTPEVAGMVKDMLVESVDSGTGGNASIPYFKIAGKTSTAQRPDRRGGYTGYVSGFIGFPASGNKKFVIYVYIDNPKSKVYYGNAVAAPAFKKVAQHILYKSKDTSGLAFDEEKVDNRAIDTVKIKHSSRKITKANEVPDFIGLDKMSVNKIGSKTKLRFKHLGAGIVSRQKPMPGSPMSKDTVIELFYTAPKYD